MKRPIGLIFSAVVLSLAALFLLLISSLMAFAGISAGHQPTVPATPHFVTYLMIAISGFYIALAIWAILTVIGILRLRSWARYSILIIGGGLAFISILAVFGLLLSRTMLPTLQTQQPAADPRITFIVFLVMGAINLLVAAVGIWWLIYFNRRAVRELFQNPVLASEHPGTAGSAVKSAPLAITLLACFFLFGAVCCIPLLFLPLPAFLLGFILPIPLARAFYLVCVIFISVIGYGLIKLREPARIAAIAFLILGICNAALTFLPWYQAQFRQYTANFISMIPTMPGQPTPSYFYSSTMIISSGMVGLIINLFLIWLLQRHRAAFRVPPPETMLEA
ncbi:hypothetical protein [Tunturibacter empetritectus]|uniref:Uncharacterized protein n=1 Tax=Tunturiibacter empetritectus TaxID=3069691 RepID=A0A7W8MR06_9BACT|nr:hypothetical protein [Edaphobacter lichenicola]MBB5316752.1 hypothetical protein [Edaphobacter lichenicola]